MARATRSTTAHEKEKPAETPPLARKAASKKRKRPSAAGDPSDQPASKLARTDDAVKEEDVQDMEEIPAEEAKPELPSSGDVPLQPEDAEKILEVLEMIDTQGLLDRIFPLPTEHNADSDSTAGPSTNTQSYSFRTLLKSPSKFPLRVLRLAIHHLFPISSHPRARPSATAAEQLRFCHLALSLVNQASVHNAPVPLDVESILASHETADESGEDKPQLGFPVSKRKYALVQRLPTGDWWTSTSSSYPSLSLDGKDAKGLGTGHAELALVFPSIPLSPSASQSKLGDYVKRRPPVKNIVQQPRRVSCGKFLDYGPFASFAPTFEQEGTEVGRVKLGEVVWYQEMDRREKEYALARRKRPSVEDSDVVMVDDEVVEVDPPRSNQAKIQEQDLVSSLESLLSPEQISSLKRTLNSEELEREVDELLLHNTKALARLEELQIERLLAPGCKQVEENSEEWDLAQGILNSLTLLASLRPRTSDFDEAPLVPTVSALRKLHRTLPLDTSGGWHGTLPEGRASAIRDDTTLHVRPGTTIPAPAPVVATTPVVPVTPTAAKPPTTSYSYAYPNYASTSYRSGYGTYYPNYPNSTTAATTPTATTPTTHYQNQYTSGTQPYSSYSGWYNYQQTTQNGAAAAASPTGTTGQTSYGFFPNTQTQQPAQRAVANTVVAKPAAYSGGWSNGSSAPTAYVAPLPAHLRSSAAGTPQPAGTPAATAYSGYYAGYQAAQAQSTAR